MKIELWHGSSSIIEKPIFGFGKSNNDYGIGFYCTQECELAKEWACPDDTDGYANHYAFETNQMKILNLSSDKYSILSWLALLVNNRQFQATSPVGTQGIEYLREQFLPDISGYDAIVGYRADDSYFSFARAFVNNTISVDQLAQAMRLGKLGEQFVLKSEKAFKALNFLGYEEAPSNVYYVMRKSRDDEARNAYSKSARSTSLDGLFMRDIIRERVKNDDKRLR